MYKRFLVTTALLTVLGTGAASAATVSLSSTPTGPTLGTDDIGVFAGILGTQADKWYFKLDTGASGVGAGVDGINIKFSFGGLNIDAAPATGLGLKLFQDGNLTPLAGGAGITELSYFAMTAGTQYFLEVTGSVGGGYAGQVSPVPLPAAAWLLISGLAGVGVFARRRRREDAVAA